MASNSGKNFCRIQGNTLLPELRMHIDTLPLQGKGAPAYFLDAELVLKFVDAAADNHMAAGQSQALIAADLAAFLHDEAKKLPDGYPNKDCLAKATCGRAFMLDAKRRLRRKGLVDIQRDQRYVC
jgi:hypothetical protein